MEKGYMISDASKILEVENHVLRYWEEELELPIPRNDMGHRYYREEEIRLLGCVKELKENGFQLKAIKKLLPDLEKFRDMDPKFLYQLREELNRQVLQERSYEVGQNYPGLGSDILPRPKTNSAQVERLHQFEMMMGQMIRGTMEEMSRESEKRICDQINIDLQKEMNYLLLQKEELHEKQVLLLKEILSQVRQEKQEEAAREAAACQEPVREKKRKKKLFAKSVS